MALNHKIPCLLRRLKPDVESTKVTFRYRHDCFLLSMMFFVVRKSSTNVTSFLKHLDDADDIYLPMKSNLPNLRQIALHLKNN